MGGFLYSGLFTTFEAFNTIYKHGINKTKQNITADSERTGRNFPTGKSRIVSRKMISVTTVRVTSDLSLARVYLSIFPSEKANELLVDIKQIGPKIRFELGKRTGKQLRVIPSLEFFIDDSLDYIDHIDSLLK